MCAHHAQSNSTSALLEPFSLRDVHWLTSTPSHDLVNVHLQSALDASALRVALTYDLSASLPHRVVVLRAASSDLDPLSQRSRSGSPSSPVGHFDGEPSVPVENTRRLPHLEALLQHTALDQHVQPLCEALLQPQTLSASE
jgi:hypothetical protein